MFFSQGFGGLVRKWGGLNIRKTISSGLMGVIGVIDVMDVTGVMGVMGMMSIPICSCKAFIHIIPQG